MATCLEPTHQRQDENDNKDEADDSRRAVAPAAAIAPRRQSADENEHEYDQKYRSERHALVSPLSSWESAPALFNRSWASRLSTLSLA